MSIRSPAHAAFGNATRRLRGDKGLSQETLAELCGLDRTYVSGVERGVRNPSLTNILKIAAALKVRPSELFARTEALQSADEGSPEKVSREYRGDRI